MSERVAIVGSRGYPRLSWVRSFVDSLPEGSTVVSGGARGVDRAAVVRAKERGLTTVEIEADWSKGRGAGIERNTAIVDAADHVVAFWDGESRGTADTIRKAEAAGKLRAVVRPLEGVGPHAAAMQALNSIKWRSLASEPGPAQARPT